MIRKFSGGELIVATHNKGKLAEIGEMFRREGLEIKLSSAAEHGLESPEETGVTCVENALLKAKFVAKATGKIALADDSGLFVSALNGAPGVYSADWAETDNGRDFKMAMERVHKEMGDNPDKKAYFTSVLTLCWPDGHCETVEGFAHGVIVWPPRGTQGHGYDPIFMPQGRNLTYGEITDAEKNKISHRADAFRKMMGKCFRPLPEEA
ncbi:MAG: RdgB/HAM1 family non-canonical purine NTP pyrophosphatase [Alphaproteobacteria bacterium]|nr:RdgB/HAM1 family non-canonical purine NTP pyrophosphatase [Alphaproteobacteria bacterium]